MVQGSCGRIIFKIRFTGDQVLWIDVNDVENSDGFAVYNDLPSLVQYIKFNCVPMNFWAPSLVVKKRTRGSDCHFVKDCCDGVFGQGYGNRISKTLDF